MSTKATAQDNVRRTPERDSHGVDFAREGSVGEGVGVKGEGREGFDVAMRREVLPEALHADLQPSQGQLDWMSGEKNERTGSLRRVSRVSKLTSLRIWMSSSRWTMVLG